MTFKHLDNMLGVGVNVWFPVIGHSSDGSLIKTQHKSPERFDDDNNVYDTAKMQLQSLIVTLLDNVEDDPVLCFHIEKWC